MKKIISLVVTMVINQTAYANGAAQSTDFDNAGEKNELSMDTILKIPLEELMEIEVVSKQKENKNSAAGIISLVTRQDIERYGANNLADVLNRVTSVYMLSTSLWMNGVAAMRGDSFTPVNNHTLVLIDGRPVRDGLNGGLNGFVFRDFPIHQIQQIEVIRGAGSVLYGTNAFSAVINIVTLKKQDNKLVVRGRYGSFDTGQIETEFAWKNNEAFISGAVRHRDSKGWLFSAIGSDKQTSRFRTDEEDTSASFSAKWHDFTLNGFIADGHYNEMGAALMRPNQVMDNNKVFLDIGYKKQLTSHWLTQTNLTYNRIAYDSTFSGGVDSAHENSLLFENTHFFNFLDKKLNLLIGGLTEIQMGSYNGGSRGAIPSYAHLRGSIYGEVNYAVLDKLKINLGGQWNHFEHLDKSLAKDENQYKASDGLVGRLGLVYDVTTYLGLKLLYSQAFRSPSAFELAGSLFNNNILQPETIETYDAQLFYHDKNYEASITAFRSRESNLIIQQLNPVTKRQGVANAGKAIFEGLELETKAKLYQGLYWTGAYTFQTNRDGNKQNNVTQIPNHLMKVGLSYDVTPEFQFSVFDTFASAAKVIPAAPLVNPAAKGYHHITLNAQCQLNRLLDLPLTKRISFSFFVDNLLDVKAYYPEINRKTVINTLPANPGRTLWGELAVEF
jgi:outer membrane receptor for ferrienterochelin and colicins